MTQHLVIFGDPVICDRAGCDEPAVIYLRELDDDGEAMGVAYCETCWIRARRAFSPLTARDAVEAQEDIEHALNASAEA